MPHYLKFLSRALFILCILRCNSTSPTTSPKVFQNKVGDLLGKQRQMNNYNSNVYHNQKLELVQNTRSSGPEQISNDGHRYNTLANSFLNPILVQMKDQTLTRREAFSPSALRAIYNYLNKKPEKQQMALSRPLSKPQPIETLTQVHNQQPIALGREPNIIKRPQLDEPEYTAPIMLSNGHTSALPNIIDKSRLFHQVPMNSNDDQMLTRFYLNNLNSQQIVRPPRIMNSQEMILANPLQYTGSASNLHDAQHNSYDHQDFYPPPKKIATSTKRKQLKDQAIFRPQDNQLLESSDKAIKPGTKQKNTGKMLSNAQLVTLIDELKEFNNRQASKIQSGGLIPPSNKKNNQKLHPDAKSTGPKGNLSRSNPPAKRKYPDTLINPPNPKRAKKNKETDEQDDMLNKQKYDEEKDEKDENEDGPNQLNPHDKMSAEDLAKFAKFLMTKEGANMKFQLGLEKESPDDGDNEIDERDVLLESKKKDTKAPKDPTNELDELDKRHSEAALKMDRLIDGTAEGAQIVDRSKKRKPNIVKGKLKDTYFRDDFDKARKRRDQSMQSSDKQVNRQPNKQAVIKEPIVEADEDTNKNSKSNSADNFAKMLIKQEIVEDQRESAQDPPTLTRRKIERSSGGQKDSMSPNSKISDSNDVLAESTLPISQADQGEDNSEYPKQERGNDHLTMRSELDKTRKSKSKTRSRVPVPVDSILRRALDGDMSLQTEKLPDGRLSVKDANKEDLLTMDISKQDKSDASSGDEEGTLNSEVAPSRSNGVKENQTSSNVKIQSEKPLKDEYPISEKVSDRLNKLSNNLDRYFNDGFMQEIEIKAKLDHDIDNQINTIESHQPQSTNVNSTSTSAKHLGQKVDHDFDVDVSIDGKRDLDRDDDDSNQSDGDENDENDSSKTEESRPKRRKFEGKSKRPEGKKAKPLGRKANKSDEGPPTPDNADGSKKISRGELTRSEKIEFEDKSGKGIPNLDPVENETLETPIGPDGDSSEPDLTTTTKIQSIKGSNVSSSKGKKANGKFYEEPDWSS